MKYFSFLLGLVVTFYSFNSFAACNYPDDRDSAGRRCGGRAASVIPGGNLGGNGKYTDYQGRQRVYGKNNDQYDKLKSGGTRIPKYK